VASQTVCRIDVRVGKAPHRPLRVEPDAPADALRQLEKPSRLFGVVVLSSREGVVAAIERWITVIARPGETLRTTSMGADKREPSGKGALVAGAPGNLAEELAAATSSFNAVMRGEHEHRGGHGFSLSTAIATDHHVQEHALHLGMWLDLERGDVDSAAAERALVEIIDALAPYALQAMVGRWDWAPELTVDITPYEAVCGVRGRCTTTRSWAERYARGVTRTMWLGPKLLARLDRAALSSVAEVTELGALWRVVLYGDNLGALEHLLAPILADKAGWRRRIERLYGRG
jgi:hypothetical protein